MEAVSSSTATTALGRLPLSHHGHGSRVSTYRAPTSATCRLGNQGSQLRLKGTAGRVRSSSGGLPLRGGRTALRSSGWPSNGSKWFAGTWLDNKAAVEVGVSAADAWDMWEDSERVVKWMPWIRSVQVINKGEPGPKRSRWTLQYDAFGQSLQFSWLSQDLKSIKHQKLHWRSVDGLPNKGAVRFFPRGSDSCTVELTISYEVPGVLAPFASGLTPLVESIIQRDMERFAVYAKQHAPQAERR